MAVSIALAPTPVTLSTGIPGGIYHPLGNAICRMFNLPDEHQARPCVAIDSDGSVTNIQRVESGESPFGLSQTDVAFAAFHGEGSWTHGHRTAFRIGTAQSWTTAENVVCRQGQAGASSD